LVFGAGTGSALGWRQAVLLRLQRRPNTPGTGADFADGSNVSLALSQQLDKLVHAFPRKSQLQVPVYFPVLATMTSLLSSESLDDLDFR